MKSLGILFSILSGCETCKAVELAMFGVLNVPWRSMLALAHSLSQLGGGRNPNGRAQEKVLGHRGLLLKVLMNLSFTFFKSLSCRELLFTYGLGFISLLLPCL